MTPAGLAALWHKTDGKHPLHKSELEALQKQLATAATKQTGTLNIPLHLFVPYNVTEIDQDTYDSHHQHLQKPKESIILSP